MVCCICLEYKENYIHPCKYCKDDNNDICTECMKQLLDRYGLTCTVCKNEYSLPTLLKVFTKEQLGILPTYDELSMFTYKNQFSIKYVYNPSVQ